jgi:hypothetical protein
VKTLTYDFTFYFVPVQSGIKGQPNDLKDVFISLKIIMPKLALMSSNPRIPLFILYQYARDMEPENAFGKCQPMYTLPNLET